MTTTEHPLTETAAAELWDARLDGSFWRELNSDQQENALTDMRSGWDAALKATFAVAPADPHHDPRPWQDCTRDDIRAGDLVERRYLDLVRVGVAHYQDEGGNWYTEDGLLLAYDDCQVFYRRIPAPTTEKETTMAKTTPTAPSEPLARTLLGVPEGHGAPHHDAGAIKPGDFVMEVDKDGYIRAGIAYRQGKDGDWRNEGGHLITWADRRADRPDAVTIWPALTPPAEEITLPTEHPAHITDVKGSNDANGAVCAYMAINRFGTWHGVDRGGEYRAWPPRWIAAFTLPDGTRARRDGERPDGTPRFVKEASK